MLRKLFLGTVVVGIAGVIFTDAIGQSDAEKKEGYQALFDGKSLKGWVVMGANSWQARNGVLYCSGEGSGWLRTTRQFQDFILRLDFSISKGGNSGIFIRAAEEGNPAFSGMEIQILDDYDQAPDTHSAGALYGAVAPAVNASKPAGEWNQVEIACVGRRVRVTMNGRRLYAVNLDDKELNATLRDDQKLTNRVPTGFIGLQNHGKPVEFRNIRIKDMSPSAGAQCSAKSPRCPLRP